MCEHFAGGGIPILRSFLFIPFIKIAAYMHKKIYTCVIIRMCMTRFVVSTIRNERYKCKIIHKQFGTTDSIIEECGNL